MNSNLILVALIIGLNATTMIATAEGYTFKVNPIDETCLVNFVIFH